MDSHPEIPLSNITIHDISISDTHNITIDTISDIITVDNTTSSTLTIVPYLEKASQLVNPPHPPLTLETDRSKIPRITHFFPVARPQKRKNPED